MQYSATLYREFTEGEHKELDISPEQWHGDETDLQGVLDCLQARIATGAQAPFWEGSIVVRWQDGQVETFTRSVSS